MEAMNEYEDKEWLSTPGLSDFTYNFSLEPEGSEQQDASQCAPLDVCSLLAAITGCIMNVLNIFIIRRRFRRNMSFYFKMLVSLATSDTLLDLALITWAGVYVGDYCTHSWIISDMSDVSLYCFFSVVNSLLILGMMAALLNLTVIAFDHFLLIVKPLKHGVWLGEDSKASNVVPFLVWGVSFLFVSFPWVMSPGLGGTSGEELCMIQLGPMVSAINYGITIVLTLVCLTVMVVCYTFINIHMRRTTGQNVTLSGIRRNNRKLLTTSLLLLGTFLLCFLPYVSTLIVWLCASIGFLHERAFQVFELTYKPSIVLFAINTVCDPLIYAVRIERVRDAYKQLWVKLTGCQSGDSESLSRGTSSGRTKQSAV